MSYRDLNKALGFLAQSLSSHNANIDSFRAANAFEKFSKEIVTRYNQSTYRIGDVCWIEFGNNLNPEMAYKHMGIVIRNDNPLYYVLPITTKNSSNRLHCNAYHVIDNPEGNHEFVLLKAEDYTFLDHDSVVKASEIKAVSVKRILSRCGGIDTSSELYKTLMKFSIKRLFPTFDYELNLMKKENSLLKMKLYLAELDNQYTISDLSEISVDGFDIPEEFEIITFNEIENVDDVYKYLLKIKDKYNQVEEKEIIYVFNRTE